MRWLATRMVGEGGQSGRRQSMAEVLFKMAVGSKLAVWR